MGLVQLRWPLEVAILEVFASTPNTPVNSGDNHRPGPAEGWLVIDPPEATEEMWDRGKVRLRRS